MLGLALLKRAWIFWEALRCFLLRGRTPEKCISLAFFLLFALMICAGSGYRRDRSDGGRERSCGIYERVWLNRLHRSRSDLDAEDKENTPSYYCLPDKSIIFHTNLFSVQILSSRIWLFSMLVTRMRPMVTWLERLERRTGNSGSIPTSRLCILQQRSSTHHVRRLPACGALRRIRLSGIASFIVTISTGSPLEVIQAAVEYALLETQVDIDIAELARRKEHQKCSESIVT